MIKVRMAAGRGQASPVPQAGAGGADRSVRSEREKRGRWAERHRSEVFNFFLDGFVARYDLYIRITDRPKHCEKAGWDGSIDQCVVWAVIQSGQGFYNKAPFIK